MNMPLALVPTDSPAPTPPVGQTYAYCPARQINLVSDGRPFVEVANFFGPSMTINSSGSTKDDD